MNTAPPSPAVADPFDTREPWNAQAEGFIAAVANKIGELRGDVRSLLADVRMIAIAVLTRV
jgi:hypothetical protein